MTVVIVTIGTTMAMPFYIDWVSKAELNQAARETHAMLTLARTAALSRGNLVQVTFTTVDGRIQVRTSVGPGTRLGSHVTGFTGGPTIAFSSLGLSATGANNIQFTNDEGLVSGVFVTAAGKATWCRAGDCP